MTPRRWWRRPDWQGRSGPAVESQTPEPPRAFVEDADRRLARHTAQLVRGRLVDRPPHVVQCAERHQSGDEQARIGQGKAGLAPATRYICEPWPRCGSRSSLPSSSLPRRRIPGQDRALDEGSFRTIAFVVVMTARPGRRAPSYAHRSRDAPDGYSLRDMSQRGGSESNKKRRVARNPGSRVATFMPPANGTSAFVRARRSRKADVKEEDAVRCIRLRLPWSLGRTEDGCDLCCRSERAIRMPLSYHAGIETSVPSE